MPESIWPYDIISDPTMETPPSPHEVTCFVLLRSEPKDIWDDLMELIRQVCNRLRQELQVDRVIPIRAIDIASSGVIHHEIWSNIKQSDIVIADVTGHNPNVMFELGVAAASKDKRRVILLREDVEEKEAFPFDVIPARHVVYRRTFQGHNRLFHDLFRCMFDALAAAPFESLLGQEPNLPFSTDLTDGKDSPILWSPEFSHRRLLPEHLEFGSLHHFASSWISVGGLKIRNLRVRADMRFTTIGPRPDPWIGIAIRSQGFYANFGYLVHLHPDGRLKVSLPNPDKDPPNVVSEFGQVKEMANNYSSFVSFDIRMDEEFLTFSVGSVSGQVLVSEMPHVHNKGRILFQTAFTRAGLRKVLVEAI